MEPSHASAVKLIRSIGRSGTLHATGNFFRHQAGLAERRNAGDDYPIDFPHSEA